MVLILESRMDRRHGLRLRSPYFLNLVVGLDLGRFSRWTEWENCVEMQNRVSFEELRDVFECFG